MKGISTEDSIHVAEQVLGSQGVRKYIEHLRKRRDLMERRLEKLREDQIRVEAAIQELTVTVEVTEKLVESWSLPEVEAQVIADPTPGAEEPVKLVAVPQKMPDTLKAEEEGLCRYKEEANVPMCHRKLKTKVEKELGYCKPHATRLELLGHEPKSVPKPRKRTSKTTKKTTGKG